MCYLLSFLEEFYEVRRGFVGCFENLADKKWTEFCNFLDAAQLNLQVTANLTILWLNTIEIVLIKFVATHADSPVSKL